MFVCFMYPTPGHTHPHLMFVCFMYRTPGHTMMSDGSLLLPSVVLNPVDLLMILCLYHINIICTFLSSTILVRRFTRFQLTVDTQARRCLSLLVVTALVRS